MNVYRLILLVVSLLVLVWNVIPMDFWWNKQRVLHRLRRSLDQGEFGSPVRDGPDRLYPHRCQWVNGVCRCKE